METRLNALSKSKKSTWRINSVKVYTHKFKTLEVSKITNEKSDWSDTLHRSISRGKEVLFCLGSGWDQSERSGASCYTWCWWWEGGIVQDVLSGAVSIVQVTTPLHHPLSSWSYWVCWCLLLSVCYPSAPLLTRGHWRMQPHRTFWSSLFRRQWTWSSSGGNSSSSWT